MADVQFVEGSTELLDKVDSLWKKLNKHHQTIANPFQDSFSQMTFEMRRAHWLDRAKSGLLRIDIALLEDSEGAVGYCVTSIDNDFGEIESIFIDESYRKLGLGGVLMKRALNWLDRNDVIKKRLNVAVGNEQVLPFYQKYGFYPRAIILEQR